MDTAYQFVKKTAFLLAAAIAIAAPARAQSQLLVSSPTVALNDNQARSIQVTASGTVPVTYTVSGVPFWLNSFSSNNFTTPDVLTFQIFNTNCGTCTAAITLTPAGVGNGSPVTVTVSYAPGGTGGSSLVASPLSLTFSAAPGQGATTQNVNLSTGGPGPVAITGIASDQPTWLSAAITSGSFAITVTNPATLTVSATAAVLASGSYTGHITITPSVGPATTITVMFTVGSGVGNGPIVPSPGVLTFNAPSGQITPPQNVSLTTTSTSALTIVQVLADVSWLSAIVSSGSLTITPDSPATLSVTASAASLSNGTYVGHVSVIPSAGAATIITVNFNVGTGNGSGTITASQTSFQFGYPGNALSAPVTIGSNNPAVNSFNVNISSQFNWLLFQGVSGAYSGLQFGAFTISVNPAVAATLATGSYTGVITLINPQNLNDTTTIVLTLTVNGGTTGALAVNPTALMFSATAGSPPQSQNLTITPAGNATVQLNITSFNGPFFSLSSPFCGGTPNSSFSCSFTGTQTLTVTVNPSGLTQLGTYTGTLVFQSGGATVTVPLTLMLTAPVTALNATPTALSFNAAAGSPAQTQIVAVSVPGNAAVQLSVTSFNGNFFAVTSPTCIATPATNPACTFNGNQNLNVTVIPTMLTNAGTYNGNIQLQSGGVIVNVSVSLTLSSTGTGGGTGAIAAPASLTFAYQANSAVVVPQQVINVGAVGAFSISSSVSGTQQWLAASAVGTTGPGFVVVTVSPQGLAAGTYSGTVVVSSAAGVLAIPVTLAVTSGIVVEASPGDLVFSYQAGSPPVQLSVALSASDNSATTVVPSTVTPWIAVGPQTGPTTPATLTVTVNPAGLCNGLNTGAVTITAPNAANSGFTIPVVVLVSGSTATCSGGANGPLMLGASSLTFSGPANGPFPPPQTLTVSAPSPSTSYTVGFSVSGGPPNWLVVVPNGPLTGSQTLLVSANTTGLGPGTYNGTISLNTNGALQTVQVTLMVTPPLGGNGLLAIPASLTFTAQSGQRAGSQTVTLSTNSATPITILGVATDSPNYLSAAVTGGTFSVTSANPATLTVTATAERLPIGPFVGHITVNSTAGVTTITVTLNVLSGSSTGTIVANPPSLVFFGASGQSTPAMTVNLATATPSPVSIVSIVSDVNWLATTVSGLTVSSNGSVTLSVVANAAVLSPGFYVGHITLTPSIGSNTVIAVTFLVQAGAGGATITATPPSFQFVYPGPASALVAIASSNSSVTTFNAAVSSQGNWLLFGNSPSGIYMGLQFGSFLLRVDPAVAGTLPMGTYPGVITLINPQNPSDITTVPLTLMVTGGANLAQGKAATQSSTLPGVPTAGAASAVDGNTDGLFYDGSVTATNLESNPWWQVDLGASVAVNSIVIWNRTDCCAARLNDYWVFVSDIPFLPTDTPATLQFRANTFFNHQTGAPNPSTIVGAGFQGRYVRVQLSSANYLSLAEVQVFGIGAPIISNLALGKTSTQSSTLQGAPTAVASAANDGNTDGNFFDGSVTATNLEFNPWWQVDLGVSAAIGSINIWNRTDCCGSRLNDYWVFVSDTPFLPTDTPATLQFRPGTFSSHQVNAPNPMSIIAPVAQGRYVRVQLTGANYLSLAEVQVLGVPAVVNPNLAQGKGATQSSTLPGTPTAAASSAVDGNTDGNFFDGSVTATNLDANAWWQVDLGASATVNSVTVWNRTDCCGARLNDYWVFISDTPFQPTDTPATLQFRTGTFGSHITGAPNPSITTAAGVRGRYVRVQLSGTNYLSLAEVQVIGQ